MRNIKIKLKNYEKKFLLYKKNEILFLETVAKQRNQARNELLKNLNPVIKDYMKEKNIRMVVDKKVFLLADDTLDITKDIIDLLNKRLKIDKN